MENEKKFSEIYKGKADLSKYGFSDWQISKINSFCEIIHSLYEKGENPENDLSIKLVILKMKAFVITNLKCEGDYYKGFFYEYTDEVKKNIEVFLASEAEVWDKIRKYEKENPERAKKLSELAFKVATGT